MLFSSETSEMSRSEPFVCQPTDGGRVGYHSGSQDRLPEYLGAFGGKKTTWLPGVEIG